MQYSNNYTLCSRPEVANDVISRTAVGEVHLNVHVLFGDFKSKRSWDMRRTHFVMDEEQRRQLTALTAIGRNRNGEQSSRRSPRKLFFDP